MPLTPRDTDAPAPDALPEPSVDDAVAYVRANPIRALLAAATVGFVLGRLLF